MSAAERIYNALVARHNQRNSGAIVTRRTLDSDTIALTNGVAMEVIPNGFAPAQTTTQLPDQSRFAEQVIVRARLTPKANQTAQSAAWMVEDALLDAAAWLQAESPPGVGKVTVARCILRLDDNKQAIGELTLNAITTVTDADYPAIYYEPRFDNRPTRAVALGDLDADTGHI